MARLWALTKHDWAVTKSTMSKLAAIAMLNVIVDTGLSPQNSVAGWTRIGIEAGKVINRDKVLVDRRVECFASTGKECKPDHPILAALQNGKDFSAKQSRKGWKSHDTEVEMTLANAMPKGPEEEVLARQVGDLERTLKARAKLALNVGPGALDVCVLPESGSASATAPLKVAKDDMPPPALIILQSWSCKPHLHFAVRDACALCFRDLQV